MNDVFKTTWAGWFLWAWTKFLNVNNNVNAPENTASGHVGHRNFQPSNRRQIRYRQGFYKTKGPVVETTGQLVKALIYRKNLLPSSILINKYVFEDAILAFIALIQRWKVKAKAKFAGRNLHF